MSEQTEFEERRKDAPVAILTLIKELADSVHRLNDSVLTLDQKFDKHVKTQGDDLKTAMDTAFPEGDADGHRRHHEAVIKAAEDRAKFWQSMRTELAKWGLIGFTGWLVFTLWQAFLSGPHK